MASLSRLYSSRRICSANEREPFAVAETEPCLYSIGGTELDRVFPGSSAFVMDER